LGGLTIILLSTAGFFPWATDSEPTPADTVAQRQFYSRVYASGRVSSSSRSETPKKQEDGSQYADGAVGLHVAQGTKPKLANFLRERGLVSGRGLEIGSGVGYFQDVMGDYTGLDISESVARFYTKRFVLGTATALPFPDNEFDIAFSFYVLEHVPNPEQALREARRVVKSGGYLYLEPSWNCSAFAPQGYAVRPYSDFGVLGKFLKAIEPVISSSAFRATHVIPSRMLRLMVSALGPTRFHYSRITPNYTKYWMSDSDAVNTLDRLETALWFMSRGDECVNCDRPLGLSVFRRASERRLIIRVKKS
jgi:ubiquinone/menaquinone biosynthesis C-methylase UbiE